MKPDFSRRDRKTHMTDHSAALSTAKPGLLNEKLEPDGIDGHALVARCLKELGVTHAYSVSGIPIRETLASCLKVGIRPIGVRNQQAGVMMATAQMGGNRGIDGRHTRLHRARVQHRDQREARSGLS